MTGFVAATVGNPAERWRTVPSAPVLEVSDLGRVRLTETGSIITPTVVTSVKRTRPRLVIRRWERSATQTWRVARLVCEAFHGEPPSPGHVAMLRDGDSFNCRADNLQWATRADVVQATVARGRHVSGQHVLAVRRRAAAASAREP